MKNILLLVFALNLLMCSCRVNKRELQIQNISVSFLGGNNYSAASNTGNLKVKLTNADTTTSLKMLSYLEMYSPLKNPIIISISKKNNAASLSNINGAAFNLGTIEDIENTCNYDCSILPEKNDKISLTSSLGSFPYWHGYSALGGLPLFMRYHYYTLKIKKQNGEMLILQWKYSVYRYTPFNGRSKIWSSDYCEDKGGGLTKLIIK